MSRLVLTGVNLLDGDNPAVANRTIVIDGKRIASVGSEVPAPRPDDRVVDLGGRTAMPGMASCHFHATYRMVRSGPYSSAPYGSDYPPGYQALIAYQNLMTAAQHGYTIIIGAGGARDVEPAVKQAIEDGFVPGPRFTPSGRELSTTGHANDMTAPWHWGLPEVGGARVCDGADAFRRGVREEIKRGAEAIKLFVTGGHLVPGSKDGMEMTRDELAAAIDTAHSRNVLVRGHIAGKKGIMLAIELGMDIIDHCDDMDDEVIAALVETGTFVVPSIYFPKVMADLAATNQPRLSAEVRRSLDFMYEALPKAEAAGVRLLLGDDYGGPNLEHGAYGGELHSYVEDAGISPLAVIRWATRTGAEVIGRSEDLGSIETGKLADLLIIDGDPSSNISVLADHRPVAVLKDGEVLCGSLPQAASV